MHTHSTTATLANEPSDRLGRAGWAAIIAGGLAAAFLAVKGLWWLILAGVPLLWHWLYRRQIERLAEQLQQTVDA